MNISEGLMKINAVLVKLERFIRNDKQWDSILNENSVIIIREPTGNPTFVN